jgi:hypothetical protein
MRRPLPLFSYLSPMKNLVTGLTLFLVGSITVCSQTFIATPNDSTEGTYNVTDWASDFIYLENTTGSPLTMSFQTITNTMTPAGWDVVLCTNDGCFPYVPSGGSLGTIASGDSAYLHVQCGFMGIAGTKEIRVRVYQTGNPSNCDTITFLYHAISTIGLDEHSSTNDALSQNFPNPFSVSTTIVYHLTAPGGKMIVTDISGKLISEYVLHNSSGTLTIGNFTPGIYFYSVYCDDAMISRRKMIVQ